MKHLIQKLTETFSPSGYESAICDVIRTEVKALADEVHVDALGNLVARKGSKAKNGKRIMLAGHMDEIGLMATHIDENGFIRFTGLGGIRPAALTGGRVRFMDGTPGVINSDRLTQRSHTTGPPGTGTVQLPQRRIVGHPVGYGSPWGTSSRPASASSISSRVGSRTASRCASLRSRSTSSRYSPANFAMVSNASTRKK